MTRRRERPGRGIGGQRPSGRGPRGAVILVSALVLLSSVGPVRADRRDQVAADLFNDAVADIRAKKYRPAIVKLNEALARGATEPNDEQGSRSRFLARRYDPYYWLGVAHMELGDDARALGNFERSLSMFPADRKEPLIRGWKEEYGDLQARMAVLLQRMDAAPVPPSRSPAPVAAAAAPPTPPPTPVVVARVPLPAAPTASPVRPTPAGPSPLDAVIARYRSLMSDDVLGATARPLLEVRVARLQGGRSNGPDAGSAAATAADEERAFRARVAPALRTAALRAALDAYGRQDWPQMEAHLARARTVEAGAPQADVLECAAQLTRFVLGGRSDARQLRTARELFLGWRAKVGARRGLPAILSPSMRTLLGAA